MTTVHDPDFRQSWKDWESLVDVLSEKISEIDETVPELPPKDLVSHSTRSVCQSFGMADPVAGLSYIPRREICE